MSMGKRIAKRSILGTRVMVPSNHGLFEAGWIQAVKAYEDPSMPNRFSVRLEASGKVLEFLESDLVGPGFRGLSSPDLHLQPGQTVFVTHHHREMQAALIRHDPSTQDVLLRLNDDETILKKIDDIRLLESRKSARLVNSDTDFLKLADVAVSDKKRSKAIEVPVRSDYVPISGSRKRRTSENIADSPLDSTDEEEVMSECSAALLLMKLSCSPHSPAFAPALISPVESCSGASSFRSSTPSPPLSSSGIDEGIVVDLTTDRAYRRVIYQCTYPGCRDQRATVKSIEAHVRKQHLNRDPENAPDDGEEEFYYTEIESGGPTLSPRVRSYSSSVVIDAHLASLSLVDHLDMARPPHEDPGFGMALTPLAKPLPAKVRSYSGGVQKAATAGSLLIPKNSAQLHTPVTMPITIAPSVGSPGKYILISPPGQTTTALGPSIKSPVRRAREGKKCRKVYGLEQRDLWCTQCKWKKACGRFGSGSHNLTAGGVLSTSLPHHHVSSSLLMSSSSVHLSPAISSTAVKAITF